MAPTVKDDMTRCILNENLLMTDLYDEQIRNKSSIMLTCNDFCSYKIKAHHDELYIYS